MRRRLNLCGFACLLASLLPAFAYGASGEGVIAVIAATGHGKSLKKDDMASVFKRKRLFWTDGQKIQPVNLPASNPLRQTFSHVVLNATPEELEKYWNDMYFHGISPPYVLASEEAVLRFVSDTPGAIGYVSYCRASGRANILYLITPAGKVVEDTGGLDCPAT